ncbi:chaperone SurA [Fibrobacterales bacterium]|nr:chaperone SurA [Fibrobacterales bacterium]
MTGLLFSVVTALSSVPILLESIVAVVDGKVILRSDLMASLYQYQSTPGFLQLPENEQMKRVLDRIIEEKVLLSRIDRDSIVVDESELSMRVDSHIKGMAARQGASVKALENAIRAQLGVSMAQYREKLMEQYRSQMQVSRIRQKHIGLITPTRKEVEEFYAVYKDSIPQQYDCFLLSTISVPVEPSSRVVDSVKTVAEAVIDSLDRGVHWAILAKNHSQETADTSGYLRRGALDPDYERATSRLGIGEWTDNPVKTKEGWNVIRLLGKKDDGIKTANILLRTLPTASDSARAFAFADSLRNAILSAGAKTFADAAKKFSQDKETAYKGGSFGWQERKEIKPEYGRVVSNLEVGEISEPELIDGSYRFFLLNDEQQVREYNLNEDYPILENMTASYMGNKKLQTLIDQWKNEVYIDVRL